MDTEDIATLINAQTTERMPMKRRAPEAGVDVPETADVDTIVEQLKNDMERLAKQNHDKIAATLGATLSTMRQENNTRFARVEAKVKGHTSALEAMQTRTDRTDARIDPACKDLTSVRELVVTVSNLSHRSLFSQFVTFAQISTYCHLTVFPEVPLSQ